MVPKSIRELPEFSLLSTKGSRKSLMRQVTNLYLTQKAKQQQIHTEPCLGDHNLFKMLNIISVRKQSRSSVIIRQKECPDQKQFQKIVGSCKQSVAEKNTKTDL